MSHNIFLENKFIGRFIIAKRKERCIKLISNKASRKKLIAELAHFKSLNLSLFEKIDVDIEEKIKAKTHRFENCYIISENASLDTTYKPIENALKQVIGYGMGTVLIFGEAEVVYYEGEGPEDRWISM